MMYPIRSCESSILTTATDLTSQKTAFFTFTAAETSNLTSKDLLSQQDGKDVPLKYALLCIHEMCDDGDNFHVPRFYTILGRDH
jgi:hypothetical protein